METQINGHKGKWIYDEMPYPGGLYICSKCHKGFDPPTKITDDFRIVPVWNFCPMCGEEKDLDKTEQKSYASFAQCVGKTP